MIFWALRHVAVITRHRLHRLCSLLRPGTPRPRPAERSDVAPGPRAPRRQIQNGPPASRSMTLRAGRNGHFMLDARVDGTPVRFLVDTGASAIILRPEDAKRIGLRPRERNFTQAPNSQRPGPGRAGGSARTQHRRLSLRNVDAFVNEGPMDSRFSAWTSSAGSTAMRSPATSSFYTGSAAPERIACRKKTAAGAVGSLVMQRVTGWRRKGRVAATSTTAIAPGRKPAMRVQPA